MVWCRCGRTAATTRAGPTGRETSSASAASTWRRRLRGAAPTTAWAFERRTYDAGWQIGSLTKSVEPPAPEPAGEDVAALLDAAEEIVNSAAPDIMQDVSKPKRRFGKRKKKR